MIGRCEKIGKKRGKEGLVQTAREQDTGIYPMRCRDGTGNRLPGNDNEGVVRSFLREEGFLDFYLLTLFSIFMIISIALLSATAVSARKNAVATYAWLQEAADYAMRCASMDGLIGAAPEYSPLVRQYFDDGFTVITETTASGISYIPRPESPYPGPIRLTGFAYVPAGASLPGGGNAGQPGYIISIVVPVMRVSMPLIGDQYVEVPMRCFSALKTTNLN